MLNLRGMSAEQAKKARAAARASWPATLGRLSDEGRAIDLSANTTVGERLAMMWPLAVEAYRLAGIEVPRYARSEAPGRVIRPSKSGGS